MLSNQFNEDLPIGDYIGFSIVNQYRCVIKRILREQRENNANTLRNEDIDTIGVNSLMINVKNYKDAVARSNFKERPIQNDI